MEWIPFHLLVLLTQNLPVPLYDVACVLLKYVEQSQIEFLMPLYRVCIMLDCLYEIAMLDIGRADAIMVFLFLELIVEDLF